MVQGYIKISASNLDLNIGAFTLSLKKQIQLNSFFFYNLMVDCSKMAENIFRENASDQM